MWLALLRSDQVTPSSPFHFGTGSDGDIVMDGVSVVLGITPSSNVYVGLRTYQFHNLTINSGVIFKPDGYRYYVSGALAGSGTIDASGIAGTLGVAGVAPYGGSRPLPNGTAGGLSGLANPGPSAKAVRQAIAGSAAPGAPNGANGGVLQGAGGGIGAGGAGGGGGLVSIQAATVGDWEEYDSATTSQFRGESAGGNVGSFSAGTGGGGGGLNGVATAGGGSSGGWQVGIVRSFTGTVAIRSRGGSGGPGVTSGGGFSGGGGGGGAGGIVVLVVGPGSFPTPDIAGGAGGAASAGTGTSGNGGTGGSGLFLIFQ